jgi:translation initiation factor 2 gamma subunit (eIF-2gamma)
MTLEIPVPVQNGTECNVALEIPVLVKNGTKCNVSLKYQCQWRTVQSATK